MVQTPPITLHPVVTIRWILLKWLPRQAVPHNRLLATAGKVILEDINIEVAVPAPLSITEGIILVTPRQ